jgi:hypothetical protein
VLLWGAEDAAHRANGQFSLELLLLLLEPGDLCTGLLAALLGPQLPGQLCRLVYRYLDIGETLLVMPERLRFGLFSNLFNVCLELVLMLFCEVFDLLLIHILGLDIFVLELNGHCLVSEVLFPEGFVFFKQFVLHLLRQG